MTQHAYVIRSVYLENIRPGEIRTFRLPTMMPGYFRVTPTRLQGPPSGPNKLPQFGPASFGPPPSPRVLAAPIFQPGELLVDLLHGEQLVTTTAGVIIQDTPSEGDDTWRLRFHLADGSLTTDTYNYNIEVMWRSLLPVLTRRIPMSFFRQGFDDNWNNRRLLEVSIDKNQVVIDVANDLARYYRLSQQQVIDLNKVEDLFPFTTINNVRTNGIHFSIGSSDSPFSWYRGRLPFVRLDVSLTRIDPNKSIEIGTILEDAELPDFVLTLKFYLTGSDYISYGTSFEVPSSFWDNIPNFQVRESVDSTIKGILRTLDSQGPAVGRFLKPVLLGADFYVLNLRHEVATTSLDPVEGYLVIDYVGQQEINDTLTTTITTGGTVPPPITDPPLFVDELYVPRGDGEVMWKPRQPAPRTLSLPEKSTPGALANMDHIVVVMMENRSFDHMLGYLSLEGGRTDVDGLKKDASGRLAQFNYYNGHFYYPTKLTDTRKVDMSPEHGHLPTKAQMADGMAHFVTSYAKIVGEDSGRLYLPMAYYGKEQLPTYDLLAKNFLICDRWFCSHIGPTWPNRIVTLTGDLNRDSYGEPEVDTPIYSQFTPIETPNLFDHLTDRNVSWRYFENRMCTLRMYTKYTFDMTNILPFSNPVNGFRATVKAGKLPSVTFVDPTFGDLLRGNDDAPPTDLKDGQAFIATILHSLFGHENPHWDRTMLILVYDEHGGFYDHVDPPDSGVPLLGQYSGKLGPRVPAFVVSALTPHRVLHDIFDHATIAATILRRFCSPHPPRMSPRISAAHDLREAVSLNRRVNIRDLFDPPLIQEIPNLARAESEGLRTDDFHSLMNAVSLIMGTTR